ncbi:DoxX family protein [Vibrio sp.]|uniref:DoxX family protein n=1 Tax=Vibrio viridaestus TaxID=2487322 RepID=A0A3N9THV8_9VIBR|nr:DoxX family protein [Vibrio viridaestus]MDC0610674.1 DoxX family protein [Vibrio sp.]RQW63801.1 DoxX family protein [Vibrio viridaestus]
MNQSNSTSKLESLALLLARLSLASVFWLSGQTKIEGFKLNIINGEFLLGMPKLSDTTLFLFENEYALPIIPFQIAAYLATIAEHIFPVLLVLGLCTRFSALSLAIMTATIQLFVYPDAYATHLTWFSLCLFLILKGSGTVGIDRLTHCYCVLRKEKRA